MWLSRSSSTRKQNASPWHAFLNNLSGESLDRGAMHCGNPRSNVVAGNRQTRSLWAEDGAAASARETFRVAASAKWSSCLYRGPTDRRLRLAGIEQGNDLLV